MNIIFMGTPAFAVPSLQTLLENKINIVTVVTVPDRKKGRGQVISHSEIKKIAIEKELNVIQPENLKDINFAESIKSLKPDLIIVVAFRILPKEIFSIPKYGSINLHASLLPKYRGAAPINWAIINGEKETGVSTFFLKEKVDTGNILLQKKIQIEDNDNAGSMHDKLSRLGAETIIDTVKLIESGNAIPFEQNNELATPAPKIFKEDCIISWDQEAKKIHNFIRGLSPYPAAYTRLEDKTIKIFETAQSNNASDGIPGKIIIDQKKMYVKTINNDLEIIKLQTEGKKKLTAEEFINGISKNEMLQFS